MSYTGTFQCAEPRCREVSLREYDRRAEQYEDSKRQRENPWKCSRHESPDEVLSIDNSRTIGKLISYEKSYGRFWRPEGTTLGGNGIDFGPGYKAFAADFPPGTTLVITAQIKLPEDADRD